MTTGLLFDLQGSDEELEINTVEAPARVSRATTMQRVEELKANDEDFEW